MDFSVSRHSLYLLLLELDLSNASQLYQQGREVAAQNANDKAGIAKRQAKAASAMGGGSRLFNAIQGAQAATDAATQGYDTAASQAAGLAASQEGAKASGKASAELNAAATKANNTTSAATQKSGNLTSAAAQKSSNAMSAGTSKANANNQMTSAAAAQNNSNKNTIFNAASGMAQTIASKMFG